MVYPWANYITNPLRWKFVLLFQKGECHQDTGAKIEFVVSHIVLITNNFEDLIKEECAANGPISVNIHASLSFTHYSSGT